MKNKGLNKQELVSLFERFPIRVDMLPKKDRALVSTFLGMQKYQPIAKLAGVDEATIARRLKKIASVISSTAAVFLAALPQSSSISPEKMKILKDYFLANLPITRIAKNRNVSIYIVRKTIRNIEC